MSCLELGPSGLSKKDWGTSLMCLLTEVMRSVKGVSFFLLICVLNLRRFLTCGVSIVVDEKLVPLFGFMGLGKMGYAKVFWDFRQSLRDTVFSLLCFV